MISLSGKEEERQMFQQMQAMAQKQVIIATSYCVVCMLFVNSKTSQAQCDSRTFAILSMCPTLCLSCDCTSFLLFLWLVTVDHMGVLFCDTFIIVTVLLELVLIDFISFISYEPNVSVSAKFNGHTRRFTTLCPTVASTPHVSIPFCVTVSLYPEHYRFLYPVPLLTTIQT